MPVEATCPECQAAFEVADRLAGRVVPCPRCRAEVTVPARSGDEAITTRQAARRPIPIKPLDPPPPRRLSVGRGLALVAIGVGVVCLGGVVVYLARWPLSLPRAAQARGPGPRGNPPPDPVADLVRRLGERDVAAAEFAALGPRARDALPALVERLADPNGNVRDQANRALDAIDPAWRDADAIRRPIEVLVDRLRVGEPAGRMSVADGLRRVGSPAAAAVPALLGWLGQERPQREEALAALAAIDPAWRQRPETRQAVVDYLHNRVGILLPPYKANALHAIGPAAIPVVVEHLDQLVGREQVVNPNWPNDGGEALIARPVRDATLPHLLAGFGRAAVPALVERLRHPDGYARAAAMDALAALGPAAGDAVPALIDRILDPFAENRGEALWALGEVDFYWASRPEAVAAVPKWTAELASLDPAGRVAAASALGQVGPAAKAALPALRERAANARDEPTRRSAAEAVARIEQKPVPPAESPRRASAPRPAPRHGPWLERLRGGDVIDATDVARTLARALPIDLPGVVELAGHDEPWLRALATLTLDGAAVATWPAHAEAAGLAKEVAGLLAAPKPAVRERAAWALGHLGTPAAALPALRQALAEEADPAARAAIEAALKRLGP